MAVDRAQRSTERKVSMAEKPTPKPAANSDKLRLMEDLISCWASASYSLASGRILARRLGRQFEQYKDRLLTVVYFVLE